MDTNARGEMTFPDALLYFFKAPFRLQTYTNLLYLALAFPLGLIYFIFLAVGIPLGLGLTLVWIGIPILALVFAGSWGLAAMERQLAIHALGAPVPPMSQPAVATVQTVWQRVKAFFSNPVTWKGMAFLFLKLPLGIVSFVFIVALLSVSLAFLAVPFVWQWGPADFDADGVVLLVDTWGEAWLCALFGLGLLFVSLNLLNGLALVWRWMATFLLGSERFAAPPSSPVLTAGMALA
jgi:Putative sensor